MLQPALRPHNLCPPLSLAPSVSSPLTVHSWLPCWSCFRLCWSLSRSPAAAVPPGAAPQLASLWGTTRGPSCKKLVQRTRACNYHPSSCYEHMASGPDPGLFLSLPVVDTFCSRPWVPWGPSQLLSFLCEPWLVRPYVSHCLCMVLDLMAWVSECISSLLCFFLVDTELHSRPAACPGFRRDFRTELGIWTLFSTYTQCFAPCWEAPIYPSFLSVSPSSMQWATLRLVGPRTRR